MATTRRTYKARTLNFGNARNADWGTRITTFENGKVIKVERVMGIRNKQAANAATQAWNDRFIKDGALA